ncbi:HNH endonuclease [Nibricoccus aquaticus]|nr:HNH endonuclease signature motif containing protein [Nibricoccus aquaticus]
MNSLERSLVQKAGYDHGWEVVVEDRPEQVVLASALHHARARIQSALPSSRWLLTVTPRPIHRELERAEPSFYLTGEYFRANNEAELGRLLEQGARLARTLPDEPCHRFEKALAEQLSASNVTTSATEVDRLVRQRVGQNIYRESLMDYWSGACAVTGISIPELLRASHAKPWADCVTDTERLNVYNGFLLCAQLDALFDRRLMTFNEAGEALFSPFIDDDIRKKLGLQGRQKLRWITPEHQAFLAWHREAFVCATK